jgi:hypothetical protein
MKLWFKAKTYGWGWTPNTWQGWSVILLYSVLLVLIMVYFPSFWKAIGIAIIIVTLFAICYKTGEKPRWRWGK